MAGEMKPLPWKRADTPPEGCSLSNKQGLKRLLLDEWLYKGEDGMVPRQGLTERCFCRQQGLPERPSGRPT